MESEVSTLWLQILQGWILKNKKTAQVTIMNPIFEYPMVCGWVTLWETHVEVLVKGLLRWTLTGLIIN